MANALTVKGQVTIPKAMRDHMKASQGQELAFVAQPDGRVLMFLVQKNADAENPFLKWMGTGVSGLSTEEILRETRGDDCMR